MTDLERRKCELHYSEMSDAKFLLEVEEVVESVLGMPSGVGTVSMDEFMGKEILERLRKKTSK